MKTSVRWLNAYLEPTGVSAEEAERLLTFVGFPIDSSHAVEGAGASSGPDTCMDVEVTSNRGDALAHLTLAREIAAVSGRRVKSPMKEKHAGPAGVSVGGIAAGTTSGPVKLENRIVDGCPLFTLRLVRGVKVGPSPAWLVERLAAVGQRSINNVVDVTNFVLMETGNPSHVFDVAKLRPAAGGAGASTPTVIVRGAEKGEKLALLDGKTVELMPGEMVVADGVGPVSLAGIMGGQESGVSESTRDVLVEVATWSPARVRRTARRLNLRTDASHRFERVVDARTLAPVMQRRTVIGMRAGRCAQVIGASVPREEMVRALTAQGFEVAVTGQDGGEELSVTVPASRPDVKLEIDLIEEVARTIGYERIPTHELVGVRVSGVQGSEGAMRELARVLTGAGFYETVTFSFVSAKAAQAFLPSGVEMLAVSDERRGSEGTLRPSVLGSLLACRRANQDAKVHADGGVRLFEMAAVYGQRDGQSIETRKLAMVADVPAAGPGGGTSALDRQGAGLRLMRGVIDELARCLSGATAVVKVEAASGAQKVAAAFDPAASATVLINGMAVGVMGLASAAALREHELATAVVMAELDLAALIGGYPPKATVRSLPSFPATDRDLSLVVSEDVTWARVEGAIRAMKPTWMETLAFVSTYRGKPLEAGKKSVTLRMTFRDETRTLRDEEVNAVMESVIERMKKEVGAVVRV